MRWHKSGIWLLLGILALVYLPCALLCRKDSYDWKPLIHNQGAYFKDSLPADSEVFQCMLIPPFRICYGFFMIDPCFVECPPACFRKKQEKAELNSEAKRKS